MPAAPAFLASAVSRTRSPRVMPGFGLSLGFTLFYLSLIVLFPLTMVFIRASSLGWKEIVEVLTAPGVLAAARLTFGASALAAGVNFIFGLIIAWVLVRYRFPGRSFLDASVDLPFAMPTAVAGIALTTIYSPHGWIGQYFTSYQIQIAYTPLGVFVALTFIGLPFVVRTVQPVLEDLEPAQEEAAASLGASRWQTFWRVIFPSLVPALITGTTLAFARALGEYGSVVFISGNIAGKTEILPLLIIMKLEQFKYEGAAVLAAAMLVISFVLLFAINLLQRWVARRHTR